jgi:hemoglobin
MQEQPMPNPSLCTEEEITVLVHTFYARVRKDEQLGPIFNGHVADWDRHLAKLVDFWSSLLRGTGRFAGAPMPKHLALPGLTAELFQRWLALFRETLTALPNTAMAERAQAFAQRIANSLWMGYQINHNPDALPADLPISG